MSKLWTPTTVGRMQLDHRLAMAPMTRDRALPDGRPGPSAARYYTQRASLGLLITEGTQPSADGQGYLLTPGIHTAEHVAGWRPVADAVHDAGAHLVIQLMHAGRMAHPDNTPHHRTPVAPSAIAPGIDMFTAKGPVPAPVPRALDTAELATTVDDFRRAAARAVEAGADAVEIHAANGYLLHQFLAANANHRTDGYGGSPAHRARLTIEVVEAIAAEIGADRTGIRISPGNLEDGPGTLDPYRELVAAIAPLAPAYLHLLHLGDDAWLRELRTAWPTALLVNRPGRDLADLTADLDAGLADVVTVGAPVLANPDLPARLRAGAALNTPDRATFYTGGDRGYVDYPTMAA